MSQYEMIDGLDLIPAQLATVMGVTPEKIGEWLTEGLGLLLKSRCDDPELLLQLKTDAFKYAVNRLREFIDDDVTLRAMASDLDIPTDIMNWAFIEARSREMLRQQRLN